MKLHKLICPNCNGSLNIEIADGTSSVFCPYCGQNFFVDDENRSYTVNKNINIHKQYTDDAEIVKAKLKDKEDKRSWIALAVMFAVLLLMIIIPISIYEISENNAVSEGKISAGDYNDLIGKKYEVVKAHFEAAGFTDIELVDLDDTGIDFWNEGEVDIISVGGNTDFDSRDWFDPDTKVIISYH